MQSRTRPGKALFITLALFSTIVLITSIILLINNTRLICMAERWMLLGSLFLLLLLVGRWLWRKCSDKGLPVRILSALLWGSAMAILILSTIAAIKLSDKRVCHSGNYIVYQEQPFIIEIDPLPLVLYKRSGLREVRLFTVDSEILDPIGATLLVDEENDWVTFEAQWHSASAQLTWTTLKRYVLSTGQLIESQEY